MNKLIINSVKINSVNSQNLPLKEFQDGLNIICGSNEAGKSTIMKFLKECFFAPKDLVGDIELTANNTKYQIKVDGKRGKKDRVKLITPTDKNIEEILSKINQNFYQKAFSIDLDDIKNIDIDLFNIIQDHNATALAEYKANIEDDLKQYLTDGGKPNKKLTDITKAINNLDKEIRELADKENDYANISEEIRINCANRAEIKTKIENKTLIEKITKLNEELQFKQEQLEKINKDLNIDLFKNKQTFFDINSKTGLIINHLEEINSIENSANDEKVNQILETLKRDYNLPVTKELLKDINLTKEYENDFRSLKEDLNKNKLQLESAKENLAKLLEYKKQKENEIEQLQSALNELSIEDYGLFKEGLAELTAAITSINETGNVLSQSEDKVKTFFYLLFATLIITSGIYLHSKIGIFIASIGIALGCLSLISALLSKKRPQLNIYEYIKTDILPKLNKNDNFLQTIPALNTILTTENTKLNKYELIKSEHDNKVKELEQTCAEVECANSKAVNLEAQYASLNNSLQGLSTILGKNFAPEIIPELIDLLRELSNLIYTTENLSKKKTSLQAEVDDYLKDLKSFLSNNKLDATINNLALTQKTNEVLLIINENDKLKHEFDRLTEEIQTLKEKNGDKEITDLTPEVSIEELNKENDRLNEQYGQLEANKKTLEAFEGLITKRNERNIKHQQLQEIVQSIFIKKLALNIIEDAERQQRENEPNLVSAETLLAKITDGKYTKADYSARAIVSNNGEVKTQEELSRGTREQLYLAFRLGYAQNYGTDGNNFKLPLIIDDAFVNFDKDRLSNVIEALKEFAQTNQVLFFTCHKDYIKGITGNCANIIDID